MRHWSGRGHEAAVFKSTESRRPVENVGASLVYVIVGKSDVADAGETILYHPAAGGSCNAGEAISLRKHS